MAEIKIPDWNWNTIAKGVGALAAVVLADKFLFDGSFTTFLAPVAGPIILAGVAVVGWKAVK